MANRWGIPKNVEELVKEKDVNCVYCGISFRNSVVTHKTRPTWEHIVNDIRINGTENIALCCCSCNASKGTKLLSIWLIANTARKKELLWTMLRRWFCNI